MQVDWELSQSFVSDSQGIRCACILPPAEPDGPDTCRVITGNQGGGLCEFGVPSGTLTPIAYQHNHSVAALLASTTKQLYVTGCKDTQVRLLDGTTHQVVATLQGHEKPVTSLAWCPRHFNNADKHDYLLSGSWDGTAKVWDVDRHCLIATLPGHENSVCVQGLPTTSPNKVIVATGSAGMAENNKIAGFTVRLWEIDVTTGATKQLQSVANDHHGPIRDLCRLSMTTDSGSTVALATCSNDGTVKLRNSQTLQSSSTLTLIPGDGTASQHPPMLLSVTALTDDCLVGAAEDGHVAVWNVEEPVAPHLLLHPDCVWRTVALPNGDFATCCQDGTLRVFTRATDRMAPEAERQAFTEEVQKSVQKQSTGPTDEEVAKLPNWEDQRQSMMGRSEGQVQLFQKNGVAIAAQWSLASRTWIEVGQVMSQSQDRGTVGGVQYDHVLPIEVDLAGGDVAKMEIGYNNGENPFVAAQRFIDEHMLPQHHLSDIADYIQQRVGQNANPTLGGPTGGGASNMAAAGPTAGIPIASYQQLPMKGYKSFDIVEKTATTTFDKMKTKIQESGKLNEAQFDQISSLMTTLVATNRYHASKVTDSELQVLLDLLQQLPPAESFAFLDLARYAALHPDAASQTRSSFWNKMIPHVLSLPTTNLEGPAAVAIPMLSLRLFANAFKGGPGSLFAVSKQVGAIVSRAESLVTSSNKNIRLSVATILYNVCCYWHSNPSDASKETVVPLISMINTILDRHKQYEGEALYRTMVALGTIVMSSKPAKEAAKAAFLATKVEPAASPHGDSVKQVAKEVYSLLA